MMVGGSVGLLRWRGLWFVVFGLVLWCVAFGMVAGLSWASGSNRFGIGEFRLRPVEGTVETETLGPTGTPYFQFADKPYASPFTQAGGHPWALESLIEFATEEVKDAGTGQMLIEPTRDPKDAVVDLPPGLLGDPMAVPRCPLSQVTSGTYKQCPADTQIGFYKIRQYGGNFLIAPVVNVVPERGQSAEFALENTVKVDTPLLTAHLVRTCLHPVAGGGCEGGEGYGFTVVGSQIPMVALSSVELTIWGVPADPSHDVMRGRICRSQTSELAECEGGGESAGVTPVPFLTMPTDCSAGPEVATVRADSWEEPGSVIEGKYFGYEEAQAEMPAVTGCGLLRFDPEIETRPDTTLADEPVGLGVNLKIPLAEEPGSNATPQLRDTSLTLPEGMSVSPGVVDGIRACEETGPEGIDITGPESEVAGPSGELQLASGHCPDASIVGTAEAITPFLPIPVKGHVYLAKPLCGGAGEPACTEQDALDGRLYRLYLELGGEGELAETGIHFKVPLETEANPATGQLTTRALETPQAPFSELRIHLNGGPRAPIDNPAVCGPAVTTSDLTPWSAPGETPEHLLVSGTPDATPSSHFKVEGCPYPQPLNPGFTAGTVIPQAGQFSSFTLNLSRQDREQYVKGIQLQTPPGLLGMLSSVPLCEEPLADEGACPESSKIGTTRVASGAGSHPFEIGGGVYLTGPYDGSPFGLSIAVHVVAGPFNLGVVVVRARIAVNEENSTLTVTTDETGPHAVPQIVFGVPVRLQRITVNIDRPGFMFNPTNCAAKQITANITGSQNTIATVSSAFAAGGCKSLVFKPSFAVSTNAHTSRANGASLDAKLSYPKGAFSEDANVAYAKVSLPKQLPSRLTTLQRACPAAKFDANPATCPSGSIVGAARASTPLLPVGLSGPVYFVSHGGEAFPSLIVVLQGDGVRVDLTGTTFISKAGITSSTFKTVPDVPVNTFELFLPQGKGSALAANGNLCKSESKLVMPTEFIAQNGLTFKQSTKIKVNGCKAAKKARRKKK
jgi:hypothetical protein